MTRTNRLLTAISVFFCLAADTAARAAPDLRAVISREGMVFLLDQLGSELDGRRTVEGIDFELFSCPQEGGAATIALQDIGFEIKADALSPIPQNGQLTVTLYLSLSGSTKLSALNLLCDDREISCDVGLVFDDVPLRLDVEPTVSSGKVELEDAELSIDLSAQQIDLDLASCGIEGELAELAENLLLQNLIGVLGPQLEQLARDQLLVQVEQLLDGLGALSGEAANLRIEGEITNVPVNRQGLGVDLAATLTALEEPTCEVSGDVPELVQSKMPPALDFRGEHLGIALSGAFLQNALAAAWKAGLLCLSGAETGDLGGSLGSSLDVEVPRAPEVRLVRGNGAHLELVLPELRVGLSGGTTAQMKLSVDLALSVDETSAVLLTEPVVEIEELEISGEGNLSVFETLIRRALPTLISGLLTEQALLPRVFQTDSEALQDYQIYVARAETTSEHILIYAKLGRRPQNDTIAPETELIQAPQEWSAAAVDIVAEGFDDQTPPALLRYSWRIDQGEWSEPGLASRLDELLEAGQRTVEVVAVDLNDNRDPTPAVVTFRVDAEPPTITITEAPPDEVSDASLSVAYTVQDDNTAEEAVVVLISYQRDVDDADAILSQLEDERVGSATLELFPFGLGSHALTLVAQDAVGNRSTPTQILFDVVSADGGETDDSEVPANGGCCAISRQGAQTPPATSCLLLLLLALHGVLTKGRARQRARRRHRSAPH
jgi:hypothetical protein